MDNIVLSTAAFCLWDITPEKKLNICRELEFENIQVALSTEKMVFNLLHHLEFSLTLMDFTHVAIHAPWCGVTYGHNEKSKRILKGLKRIVDMMPVKEVIVRVDCIGDLEVLLNSGLPISVENSEKDLGFEKFKVIAEQSGLPLAFNLNRGFRGSNKSHSVMENLIDAYGHRICRVLVSGFDSENGRMPLISTDQVDLLSAVRRLDVPMVLEGLFDPGDLSAIVMERKTVLGFLTKSIS